MSKVLGVDFGERRTGVAISDDSRTIAFPRETLSCPRTEQAAAAVARLAEAERVAEICLRHTQVDEVRIVLDKPGALPHSDSIAVEILRRR